MNGRVRAPTKTDCLVWHDSRTSKHTSCLYNYIPKQFVGNYKNWVFAQPVKDWSTGSYKAVYDYLEGLMGMGLVADVGGRFPKSWGKAYRWDFLDLKQSERQRLVTPVLTAEELPPASSRD